MTALDEVVETKLEDEFYVGEEGAVDPGANAPPQGGEAVIASFRGFEQGILVAKGSYLVPDGVGVEELKNYGGHKKLVDKCPPVVRALLTAKGLGDVYDKFVQSVADTRTTRSGLLGKWKDAQFVSVLDQFRDDFAARGVRVALCKCRSGKGTYRWLEFIDVDRVGATYVPQYDVANMSGQIIKTCYAKLVFPSGVAVEELKQWSSRSKLKEKIPIHVERMLDQYNLRSEYDQMVDHVVEAGGAKLSKWDIKKLRELFDVYKPMFQAKGVDLFISHKQEYVSHGSTAGGHYECFRWIEFVDRAAQPSYLPQYDAQTRKQVGECTVM